MTVIGQLITLKLMNALMLFIKLAVKLTLNATLVSMKIIYKGQPIGRINNGNTLSTTINGN